MTWNTNTRTNTKIVLLRNGEEKEFTFPETATLGEIVNKIGRDEGITAFNVFATEQDGYKTELDESNANEKASQYAEIQLQVKAQGANPFFL